jgi:hypothetical protein
MYDTNKQTVMRNKPLPGFNKLPCGCTGTCKCSPLKIDLTKKMRDKLMMQSTGGLLGDESKGTDADSIKKGFNI